MWEPKPQQRLHGGFPLLGHHQPVEVAIKLVNHHPVVIRQGLQQRGCFLKQLLLGVTGTDLLDQIAERFEPVRPDKSRFNLMLDFNQQALVHLRHGDV